MTPSGRVHDDPHKSGPIKLAIAREDALRDVEELLQEGRQIVDWPIITSDELDDAQRRKLEWVRRVSQSLSLMTGGNAPTDDVVIHDIPKPSDPIESRTEHFHNEMNQRLERLLAVRKLIDGDSSPAGNTAARRPASPVRPPQPQPVAEEPVFQEPASGVESVELNLADEDGGDSRAASEAVASATAGVSAVLPASKAKPATASPAASRPKTSPTLSQTKVLLIQCSRNGTARQAICRFASQMSISLEIVDYNPDQPHSIIDQLYNHRDAKFAIVYWGEPAGRELPGSAHPERYVGFVLGFALGRLGRGRVFILGSTTTPPLPGFARILVAQLDSTGGWQIQLARRMKTAGVDIDLNKLT